ncbi:MAG: DUF4293 domain-containing protein [Bacteroidales bacterium]
MIQRIQTLWLAFIILITAATFFFPIADFSYDLKGMQMTEQFGLLKPKIDLDNVTILGRANAWSLIFMQLGVALIAVISIFLFKNRQLQVKLVAGGLLLTTIYVAFLLFIKIDGIEKQIFEKGGISIQIFYNKISMSFPILQLLLFILAQRAIKKDHRLVRSSDRLR